MPFNSDKSVFSRIWKFVDQFTSSEEVSRSDLDIAVDDVANGLNSLSGEVFRSNAKPFNTLTSLKASTLLEVGQVVRTIGHSNIFDNGGSTYNVVAAGTNTADDVFYVDLPGSGLQAAMIHSGWIRAEQAGAIHGSECSAQLQAAWDGLVAWKDGHADDPDIQLSFQSRGTLQNKVTFNRSSNGTRVDGGHLDFTGSYLTAVPGGDLSDTNPMFTVRLGGITHFGTLDGAKFAACYDFFGMSGGRTYNPEAIRGKGKVMRVRGASGSWKLYNPKGREYLQSDAEFADQANFTAIGLSLEDGDFNVYGENFLYFETPIQIAEDCVGIHLYSGHPTNGNPNYAAGSEPIYIVALGQSNLTGASASTTGDKTVESGVYIWNGDFETEGDDFAQAAFGTAPFNQGSDPWANNLLIHAANDLKTSTGRDVYLLMIADSGKKLECFIKPATKTANGWTSANDFTPFMYPQIRTAAQAIPGRNTLWPDMLIVQQGEANSADTAAEYAAKLVAMVADMKKEDLFHPTLTQMTAGGLVPGHAFLATHQTAVTTAATSIPSLSYVATTSLSDVGDGLHFTGASLVTLGERHAAAVSLASAGAGQPAFCNPVLIRNYATRRNFLHDYYLDNGLVLDYTGTLWPYDCTYVHNNRAAMTAPLWRIIASEAGQTAQPIGAVTNLSGLGSVGYVDDLENGYYWDGDLSGQEALYDEMVDGPTLVSTSPRNINLRGPSTDPAIVEVKPSGSITYRYTVGGTSIDLEFDPATGEVLSNAGDFRLYKQSATNRLLVGSGTVGIGEITGEGGKLEFLAGGAQQWHIQVGGHLRPNTADTHNIGGASRRVNEIHVKTLFAANVTAQYFNSRATFVTWLATAPTLSAGDVKFAGGLIYVYSPGATFIPDIDDWVPFGDVYLDHFGDNLVPGTTDMTTALHAWAAYCTAQGCDGYLKGEEYLFDKSAAGRLDIDGFTAYGVRERTIINSATSASNEAVHVKGTAGGLVDIIVKGYPLIVLNTGSNLRLWGIEVECSDNASSVWESAVKIADSAQIDGLTLNNFYFHHVLLGLFSADNFGNGGGYVKHTSVTNGRWRNCRKTGLVFNSNIAISGATQPWQGMFLDNLSFDEYAGETDDRATAIGLDNVIGLKVGKVEIAGGYGNVGSGTGDAVEFAIHLENLSNDLVIDSLTIRGAKRGMIVYSESARIVINSFTISGDEGHADGDDVTAFDAPVYGSNGSNGLYVVSDGGGQPTELILGNGTITNFNVGLTAGGNTRTQVTGEVSVSKCSLGAAIHTNTLLPGLTGVTFDQCRYVIGSVSASSNIGATDVRAQYCGDLVHLASLSTGGTIAIDGLTWKMRALSVVGDSTETFDMFTMPDIIDTKVSAQIFKEGAAIRGTVSSMTLTYDGSTLASTRSYIAPTSFAANSVYPPSAADSQFSVNLANLACEIRCVTNSGTAQAAYAFKGLLAYQV